MNKLLVIVDMQNDFIGDGSLGTKEAAAIVDGIAAYAKGFDGTVIATMDTHAENYMNTQEGRKLPVPHCIKPTDGWKLDPKIEEVVSGKIEKGTFGSVALGELIARNKYDSVEFCGVCTDICVISNALLAKAFSPETPVRVLRDLCAGVTPESHETALKAMASCQIEIV
ncbi:MAG: cysteine hydrolase [Lachnospiraceae bacterium]|nr:cysteine hydrolase [Lachnospiraceae bacterium]